MKRLWNWVNRLKVKANVKNGVFVGGLTLGSAVFGAVVWLLAGRYYFQGVSWLCCFVGYPAVFVGIFGGTLYLYNNQYI